MHFIFSFQMAAKYLKQQFSIPHHLVPSFEDTAGVLAHAAAEDSHLLHDNDNDDDSDDPIVPGAPVSSLRSHHAERDRSVIIDELFLHYIFVDLQAGESSLGE